MAFINRSVQARLAGAGISVFFVSGRVTKWYNAQRTDPRNEVALLGGWYWVRGGEEAGPFRTPSGAWRDAYYRLVLKTRPPTLHENDVRHAERALETPVVEPARSTRRSARKAERLRG